MIVPKKPQNEKVRLKTLDSLKILDTRPTEIFDGIADLAAKTLGVPVALITLVDRNRQWFKSKIGLDISETPRDVSFCAHAILHPQIIFEIPDALSDPRFSDNPLVLGDPKIRFYAGAPIVLENGAAVGTLCVIDHKPGHLDPGQKAILTSLRDVVTRLLERERAEQEAYKSTLEYFVKYGPTKDVDGEQTHQDALYAKVDSRLLNIPFDNILWIEANGDYISICTEHEKHVVLSTMTSIQQKLPKNRFLRIHRSYIVQLSKIKAIEDTVAIIGKKVIPIGDSYRPALMKRLKQV